MEDKFREYLLEVFRKALYGYGEEQYEKRKQLAMGQDAHQNKKSYLQELDKLAEELAKKTVAELERLGIDSADDLLAKQDLVKEKLGVVQGQMEKELASK